MAKARDPDSIFWIKTHQFWRELFEECVAAYGGSIENAADHLGISDSHMRAMGAKIGADIFGKHVPKPRRPRIRPNKRKFIKGVPRVHMTSLKERQKAEQAMADLDEKK